MWLAVANLNQLNDIQPHRVEVDGDHYVLYRTGETVYCLVDLCSHAEVPLSGGSFDRRNHEATCPQHGARFDVTTGKALSMPAVSPVRTVPAKVEDGTIFLDLDD